MAAEPSLDDADVLTDHLNDEHADSVLLVARVLGPRPDAERATVVALDRLGVDLAVEGPDGAGTLRIAWDEPVDDVLGVQTQALALVARAQERSGSDGSTSGEMELAELRRIPTWLGSVVATRPVGEHFVEVTIGGGTVPAYEPGGPDQFLYVLLPPPGHAELTVDETFGWEGYQEMPAELRPVGAYYTVRRWRPDAGELDLWFHLHDEPGPASAWAASARRGDPVALWGPRTAFEPSPEADRFVLVGDETGLPAIAAILEALDPGATVDVVLDVADRASELDLPDHAGASVRWLHRDHPTPTSLRDAVAELEPATDDGRAYVWGGGESRAVTAVRRLVRDEWGLPAESVSLVAYWRASRS